MPRLRERSPGSGTGSTREAGVLCSGCVSATGRALSYSASAGDFSLIGTLSWRPYLASHSLLKLSTVPVLLPNLRACLLRRALRTPSDRTKVHFVRIAFHLFQVAPLRVLCRVRAQPRIASTCPSTTITSLSHRQPCPLQPVPQLYSPSSPLVSLPCARFRSPSGTRVRCSSARALRLPIELNAEGTTTWMRVQSTTSRLRWEVRSTSRSANRWRGGAGAGLQQNIESSSPCEHPQSAATGAVWGVMGYCETGPNVKALSVLLSTLFAHRQR